MQPRLLKKRDAAAYMGMSERSFDELIRPYVPVKRLKVSPKRNMDRYDVRHLDNFTDILPTIVPADARREETQCNRNRQDSNSGVGSGMSTKPSTLETIESPFDAALAAAREN